MRRRSAEICVYVPTAVALYILNQKRDSLVQLEARYALRVLVARDDALIPPAFRLERLRACSPAEPAVAPIAPLTQAPEIEEAQDEVDEDAEAVHTQGQEEEGEEERGRSRRRRRRRRHRGEEALSTFRKAPTLPTEEAAAEGAEFVYEEDRTGGEGEGGEEESDAERPHRRRGRRGGRRRGRREGGPEPASDGERPAADIVEIPPTSDTREPEPLHVEAPGTEAAPESTPAVFAAMRVSEMTDDLEVSSVASAKPTIAPEGADQAERGAPFASEREQNSEGLPLPPAQPAAEQSAETVTGKPAAPRRGWWQRLIQS
jgi:ribonuclease E